MTANPANTTRRLFNIGSLAFVIVVCASYASAITAWIYAGAPIAFREAILLLVLGIAYLVIGTYGFTTCRHSGNVVAALAYFVVQLAIAFVLIILRGSSGELSLILLPLAGQSALVLPMRFMAPVCTFIYVALVMPLILRSKFVDAIALAIVYGTGIVFVVVFTRVAASERDARTALAEANQQLRDHALRVEELAKTKERNRLAREIHDSVGHYLTVVNVQIGAARTILDQDRARALDHLSKAQALTQEGLTEVRHSVAALRASPMESSPLPEALTKLVQQWTAAGVLTDLVVRGRVRPLTAQANLTLYRAAQEALTNIGKHAQAKNTAVLLDYGEERMVQLIIKDDGVGSNHPQHGFGLLGIRERVHLLNGQVRVSTEPGKGFILEVEVTE